MTLYLCDPKKNAHCSKSGCKTLFEGPCERTSNPACAKLDADGNPVAVNALERENKE